MKTHLRNKSGFCACGTHNGNQLTDNLNQVNCHKCQLSPVYLKRRFQGMTAVKPQPEAKSYPDVMGYLDEMCPGDWKHIITPNDVKGTIIVSLPITKHSYIHIHTIDTEGQIDTVSIHGWKTVARLHATLADLLRSE